MPGRLKALLIQPLPEVIGVGRGTAVFVHGRNETDGEDIRALRVTLGEDRPGYLVEMDATARVFTNPRECITEYYVSGRFG